MENITGHAKILIGLENSYLLAEKIIKKLSVRQTEFLVRLFKNKPKKNSKLEMRIQLQLKMI